MSKEVNREKTICEYSPNPLAENRHFGKGNYFSRLVYERHIGVWRTEIEHVIANQSA